MMQNNGELGSFLRSRRARLTPETVGIEPHGTARRVIGLKREEVARLAGVSVDYYARMEQGRAVRLSQAVLEAVGRALCLDVTDRAHFADLAGISDRLTRQQESGLPAVLPAFERISRCLPQQPVFVVDWRLNVLCANGIALALYLNFGSPQPEARNFARFVFFDPGARELFADWSLSAVPVVGTLRRNLARHSNDSALTDLVDDLRAKRQFDQLWRDYALSDVVHTRKLHRHPRVGEMWLDCDTITQADNRDQQLTVGSAQPGSDSEQRLKRLSDEVSEDCALDPS